MTPSPSAPIHVYIQGQGHDACIEVYWSGIQIYMGPTTAISAEAAGEAVRISLLRAMEKKR